MLPGKGPRNEILAEHTLRRILWTGHRRPNVATWRHSARRRAATDLNLSPKDVALLMQWESVEMVFYHQYPDDDTMRSALESRRQKYVSGR